jgi:hypothetical protein
LSGLWLRIDANVGNAPLVLYWPPRVTGLLANSDQATHYGRVTLSIGLIRFKVKGRGLPAKTLKGQHDITCGPR